MGLQFGFTLENKDGGFTFIVVSPQTEKGGLLPPKCIVNS